ncbi:multicopper oxidase family protein [Allorhizocola rhizosphaerae]|uniref:multicopper oxidase family protein n=1 Tax=Allorhizocola rhizosphaerae TaxID=1872709 RepID=UPI000E3BBE85|nr:multicopper oxidase family protein [Allorhizocola rhizosphaerae]
MRRRAFLGLAGALAIPGCTAERAGVVLASRLPLPRPFTVPLTMPAVARPLVDGGTAYELVQRPSRVEIIPGTRTEVWGYDGTFPGPTFDVRAGRPITVSMVNELPVPTSTHLHGGVNPPQFDGYPTHLVVPTRRFVHEYPLSQPAATLWYHDHRMDFTGPQVYRGLAGMFILRDDVDDALPLPKGDKDIPLLICDRAFDADGSFLYPSLPGRPGVKGEYHQGVEGDVILVNGAPWPELEVDSTRYRFRLLNASNARRYDLRLDPAPPDSSAPFTQVGSDVGLLGAPQRLDRVVLASAERADVVVDFGAYPVGTEVTLVNRLDAGPAGQVMRFRVARRGNDDSRVPAKLADLEPLAPGRAVHRRRFDFRLSGPGAHGTHWKINGETFDPARTSATPRLGTTELWTFSSDFHHPVHVHLGHFQVYRRNGRAPGPADAGWKDTVDVRPFEVVEVLVRFEGHRGRYVLHCHNLEHEDMAMMANFDVV